jgi:hypothetical protein
MRQGSGDSKQYRRFVSKVSRDLVEALRIEQLLLDDCGTQVLIGNIADRRRGAGHNVGNFMPPYRRRPQAPEIMADEARAWPSANRLTIL